MADADLQRHAEEIHDQFSDELDISVEDVHDRLDTLVTEYRVPADEARRSVVSTYADEAGVDRDAVGNGGNETVQAAEIDQDEQWVDMRVTVADLWEPRSDSISQVGLLGDESGTTKFVAFETSDLPHLEEGKSYALGNVITDEYEGSYSVKLNRTTSITELDETIEVGDDDIEVEGALVDIQDGSGLVKRCPEEGCTRVLQNGRCNEHGEGEGEYDLRIKGVLDDGSEVHEIIFDKDATEALTGITLEEAIEMAKDALDTEVVVEEMRGDVMGQYYRVRGPTLGRYVLANETEPLAGPVDPESTLIKARSI